MDIISREELKELAETRGPICVSLYLPTNRFESEHTQNPIRMKNLIRELRRQLNEADVSEQVADTILQPAIDLLANESFWRNTSDGLAGFLTEKSARFYRLPVQFEELALVNERFHLTQLFPLIAAHQIFYLLALSQHNVRLFQCTPYTISEVHAPGIPKSIQEALWADDLEPNRTLIDSGGPGRWARDHSGRAGGGIVPESVHGTHGSTPADVIRQPHDDLLRYFQQIDHGLMDAIGEEKAPLILACVEYYVPIYKEVNSYKNLVTEPYISGSPEHTDAKQLHEKAWELVEPILQKERMDDMARFSQVFNKDRGLASADLKEVLPAAVFSRVDTLFVPVGQHAWGRYDPDNNAVELHSEHKTGDEDLLDLAAVYTYLNGGTVHAVEETNMPVKSTVAAMFRFPAENMAATERS